MIAIPGHTPGSLAFLFPAKDGRRTHVAGLFGGTILTADRITTAGLTQYVQSIAHYLEAAKRAEVDVELQNHPIFGRFKKIGSAYFPFSSTALSFSSSSSSLLFVQ